MERFLAAVAVAIIDWLDSRLARRHVAQDSTADHGRLRRAGDRIRRWMQQDRARRGVKSGEGRS